MRREVSAPVGSGGHGNRLGADAHGEDLRGVRPRNRAHRDGEATHEEVRADDDTLGDGVVVVDNPDTGAVDIAPLSEAALEAADEHKPESHEEGTTQEHGTTSPFVDVDDGRD